MCRFQVNRHNWHLHKRFHLPLSETWCYTHHTFLLGSPNERVNCKCQSDALHVWNRSYLFHGVNGTHHYEDCCFVFHVYYLVDHSTDRQLCISLQNRCIFIPQRFIFLGTFAPDGLWVLGLFYRVHLHPNNNIYSRVCTFWTILYCFTYIRMRSVDNNDTEKNATNRSSI